MPNPKGALCLAFLVSGLLVSACDEAEQNRVLRYEKGTYLGPTETPLDGEQLNSLRQRATLQGGS